MEGEVMEATKMFDLSIRVLFKQAEEAGDYLRLIVKQFEGFHETENSEHLKLFYMIIPPVSLNFVQYSQQSKDKVNKKNSKDAFISDDGFPLGIAYLLKILDQNEKFNSLNWFDSIQKKY
jgi:WASH complex subunit 7